MATVSVTDVMRNLALCNPVVSLARQSISFKSELRLGFSSNPNHDQEKEKRCEELHFSSLSGLNLKVKIFFS